MPVSLPLEVYGIIAEFLAGEGALGTVASLSRANKHIQLFLLPVLYETLIIKDLSIYSRKTKSSIVPPAGLRYTKSVRGSQAYVSS